VSDKKLKNKYKEFTVAVRSILLVDWDPIGIGSNPHLFDEYDRYIGEIANIISKDSTIEDIANLLKKIEEEEMNGLKTSYTMLHNIALKLKELNKYF
jgi:hypothetical protein